MSAHRILAAIDKTNFRSTALPAFRPGDSLKVWAKIREGEKTRLQAFEGVCIRRASKGTKSTFTVRKISYGVGVERIFPDHSPNIERIEVVQRGRVNQSRLFYLRDLSGKAARIKERDYTEAEMAADKAAAAAAAADEPAAPAQTGEAKLKGRGARKAKRDAK
jgi:large subunit ribosomal protein L19